MRQAAVPPAFLLILAASLGLGIPAVRAADLVAFTANFESGMPPEFSGAGSVESVQSYSGVGPVGNTFSGSFLRNSTLPPQPTVLTLTGLPSHTSVDIRFLLALIDTWDGNFSVPSAPVPDHLEIKVDGNTVFDQTICNSNYPNPQQSYLPAAGVALDSRPYVDRGFQVRTDFGDVAYDFGFEPAVQNVPHTGPTLTVEWTAAGGGWQGAADESWAIENVRVVLHGANVAPAVSPAGILLLASGLMLAALLAVRRARSPRPAV